MSSRVSIVGAGPAGSTAAILMARGGWDVMLIEQHRFPRDKVCGECLSADGMAVLERMGLLDELMQLKPVKLTHAAIHAPERESVQLRLPRPMLGLSRSQFDGFLLDAARASGATILQPARCQGIEPGHRCSLRIRLLDANSIVTHESDHIVVADGKGALLGAAPPPTGDFGIKAHFQNIEGPRDTIELFGCRGLYGGLAPIENGRWNAAFSVPASRLKAHRGSITTLFEEIVGENRVLRKRMSGARQVGNWLASPLPRFAVKNHWPPGVMPAGNAAAALEPIGGEGMGLALRSAELAASSLLSGRDVPMVGCYQRLWRMRRASCRATALLVSRPGWAEALVPILRSAPLLGTIGIRLLGK